MLTRKPLPMATINPPMHTVENCRAEHGRLRIPRFSPLSTRTWRVFAASSHSAPRTRVALTVYKKLELFVLRLFVLRRLDVGKKFRRMRFSRWCGVLCGSQDEWMRTFFQPQQFSQMPPQQQQQKQMVPPPQQQKQFVRGGPDPRSGQGPTDLYASTNSVGSDGAMSVLSNAGRLYRHTSELPKYVCAPTSKCMNAARTYRVG